MKNCYSIHSTLIFALSFLTVSFQILALFLCSPIEKCKGILLCIITARNTEMQRHKMNECQMPSK